MKKEKRPSLPKILIGQKWKAKEGGVVVEIYRCGGSAVTFSIPALKLSQRLVMSKTKFRKLFNIMVEMPKTTAPMAPTLIDAKTSPNRFLIMREQPVGTNFDIKTEMVNESFNESDFALETIIRNAKDRAQHQNKTYWILKTQLIAKVSPQESVVEEVY